MALTDLIIRNAKPAEKQQKLADERGLYLIVAPSGGKWWRLKYRFGGKVRAALLLLRAEGPPYARGSQFKRRYK